MDYFGHMATVAKVASVSDGSIVFNRTLFPRGPLCLRGPLWFVSNSKGTTLFSRPRHDLCIESPAALGAQRAVHAHFWSKNIEYPKSAQNHAVRCSTFSWSFCTKISIFIIGQKWLISKTKYNNNAEKVQPPNLAIFAILTWININFSIALTSALLLCHY